MALKDTWTDLQDIIDGIPDSGDVASAETINSIAHAVIELEESGGGTITETDPTVPDWAKKPNKPSYNVDEITNAVHKYDVGNVKDLIIGGNTVEAINMIYELIGDIDSALDELHNYAQELIGGAS